MNAAVYGHHDFTLVSGFGNFFALFKMEVNAPKTLGSASLS